MAEKIANKFTWNKIQYKSLSNVRWREAYLNGFIIYVY